VPGKKSVPFGLKTDTTRIKDKCKIVKKVLEWFWGNSWDPRWRLWWDLSKWTECGDYDQWSWGKEEF